MPLGALVFAVAVLPHLLALRLPFQLDDYNILSSLHRLLDAGERPAIEVYFFRPTGWVIWAILMKLGGGYAHAPLFHAVVLLSHGLTAWLLFRVLRSAVHERAAFAGAALFGLMPGGIQAVTWMAAAGDQLAVLFLLLAVLSAQRFARTGRLWTIPAIAACAFASFLAKETMVVLAPAAALGLWSVPRVDRRERRWWIPAIAAVVGLGAGIFARWANIGILGPAYAYEVTLRSDEVARLHKPLLQMLAPWSQAPDFAEMAPCAGRWIAFNFGGDPIRFGRALVLVALGVPILLGLLSDWRRVPRALVLLATFFIAFMPCVAAWHFEFVATNTLSRAFYGPLAILCAFLAICVDRVVRPAAVLRPVAVGFLVLFAVLEIDLVIHVWRTELLVADRIRSRLESLEAIARSEAPETHILAVDPESGLGASGMPLVGPGVAHALRQPFSRLDRGVSWWSDSVTLDRCPAFKKETGPIRVVEVRDHRFVALGDLIPPIPAEVPRLSSVEGRPGAFEFQAPAATRAVAAIRFQARPAAGGSEAPACTWEGDAETMIGPLVVPAGGALVTCLAIAPRSDQPGWVSLPRLKGVRIVGVEVVGIPEVVGVLPEIGLRVSSAAHMVVLGSLPQITYSVPFDSPEYRVTFDFLVGLARLPMVYSVPRERLSKVGDKVYLFVPSAGDRVEWPGHAYHVTWAGLPDAFRRELSAKGLHAIPVQFRVQGIAADGVTPEAESTWDTLTLLDQ